MTPLRPCVPDDQFWPEDAAWMARTDLRETRMLGYTPFNLDAVTTLLMGVLGHRPAVRHVSGAADQILTFLSDAGLVIEEELHRYETGAEAESIADGLVARGHRLFWPYPLRSGRFGDAAHLVPPDAYDRLNSKAALPEIVPPEALAPRRTVPVSDLPDAVTPPVFVKAGGTAATGWGYAVHHCPDVAALAVAREDLIRKGVETAIVEDALDVTCCWNVNLAVLETAVTYLGAAEQLFTSPARQSGSLIDPGNAFPPEGVELARQVGAAARARGFLGVCGLDIGRLADGRLIVFDPNFRFNASTTQVLFHEAASSRSGLPLSLSFSGTSLRPVTEMLNRARGAVQDGWFMPTRIIDAALLPAAEGKSHCTGFVLADTRENAVAAAKRLQSEIS